MLRIQSQTAAGTPNNFRPRTVALLLSPADTDPAPPTEPFTRPADFPLATMP
jgi:hypothetical protein